MLQENVRRFYEISQEIKKLNKLKAEYRKFILETNDCSFAVGSFDVKISTHFRHELNIEELKAYLGDALDSFRESKISERLTVNKLGE